MNYWHLQMSQGLQDGNQVTADEVKNFIVERRIIGTGEWKDNRSDQCKQFKEAIQTGDILLVRFGSDPIALVKVVEKNIDPEIYENEHRIEIIGLYKSDIERIIGKYEGQAMGTLTRVANRENITGSFIIKWHTLIQNQIAMTDLIALLRYKKQIVLQGPPGTGKTRLAKKIATALTGSNEGRSTGFITMDKPAIQRILKKTEKIKTKIGKELKIVEVKDNVVEVKTDDSQVWTPSYNKIIESYNNKHFDAPGRAGGFVPYEDAIAKFLFDNFRKPNAEISEVEVKLIQFHPSFSYEDFVRGIVAESQGDKIEYKNVNKILGHFAKQAEENWNDSKKDINNITKEKKVREYFELFVEQITDQLADGITPLKLTNSVSIVDVDDDAFRYKGNEGWTTLGNRMLFKDIIQAFIDDNIVRQDIKKNKNLSGLAIQHATYFVRVLNMFKDYLASNSLNFEQLKSERVQIKNYVLIIDEINRANLSSVLGELIYALEYRGEEVDSMYNVDGSNKLSLPENLFIIGTMNTADRSVGHIDYAIRRRFAFVDVIPKDLSLEPDIVFHKVLFDKVAALFDTHLSPEFEKKDVQLGHSYFIDKTSEGGPIDIRLEYEIKPILREYVKDGILIGEDIKHEIENLTA